MIWYDMTWSDMIWYDMIWCDIIIYYTILYYIILYYIILCYVMLCYVILYCIILYYFILNYIILYYIILYYIIFFFFMIQCYVYSTLYYIVLQCIYGHNFKTNKEWPYLQSNCSIFLAPQVCGAFFLECLGWYHIPMAVSRDGYVIDAQILYPYVRYIKTVVFKANPIIIRCLIRWVLFGLVSQVILIIDSHETN